MAREILTAVAPLVRRAATYDGTRSWAPSLDCGADPTCVSALGPLLETVNDLARVSTLLWTEDGKNQPLRVRVLPHPLRAFAATAAQPVAVRLVAGEGHVDYFNQKPAETVLELDWTKRQTSALSVISASQDPVKSLEPPAMIVSGSPWSFFRLLQRARKEGAIRTWRIPAGDSDPVSISMTIRENVTDAFRFRAGGRGPAYP